MVEEPADDRKEKLHKARETYIRLYTSAANPSILAAARLVYAQVLTEDIEATKREQDGSRSHSS